MAIGQGRTWIQLGVRRWDLWELMRWLVFFLDELQDPRVMVLHSRHGDVQEEDAVSLPSSSTQIIPPHPLQCQMPEHQRHMLLGCVSLLTLSPNKILDLA